jgi:hypothetical protein
MDSHQSLTPVKQDRMRHRWRGGVNWTGIFLDSSGVCSHEKDISRRYLQDVGDTLLLSSRWRSHGKHRQSSRPNDRQPAARMNRFDLFLRSTPGMEQLSLTGEAQRILADAVRSWGLSHAGVARSRRRRMISAVKPDELASNFQQHDNAIVLWPTAPMS